MAAPTVRAVGAKSAGTGATTVAAPANVATGDLELLVASTIAGGTITVSTPGGSAWSAIGTGQDATSGEKLYAWQRVRQTGDGDPIVTPGSDHVCACRIAVTVATFEAATPIEIVTQTSDTTSNTAVSYAPGSSTAGADRLCVFIGTRGDDSNTTVLSAGPANTTLSGVTKQADINTSSGGGGGIYIGIGSRATAGAVGTWTATLSASNTKAYIHFAIRPVIVVNQTVTAVPAQVSVADVPIQSKVSLSVFPAVPVTASVVVAPVVAISGEAQNQSVTAKQVAASATVPPPAVAVSISLSPPSAVAAASVPTLALDYAIGVNAVVATTLVLPPTISTSAGVSIAAVPATAASSIPAPVVSIDRAVASVVATATAVVIAPVASIGYAINAVPAVASASATPPTLQRDVSLAPTSVSASAVVTAPTVSISSSITAVTAVASAVVNAPSFILPGTLSISAVPAVASSSIPTPSLSLTAAIAAPLVTAEVVLPTPARAIDISVSPVAVTSGAVITRPTLSISFSIGAPIAAASAVVPRPVRGIGFEVLATPVSSNAVVVPPEVSRSVNITATSVKATSVIPPPSVSATGVHDYDLPLTLETKSVTRTLSVQRTNHTIDSVQSRDKVVFVYAVNHSLSVDEVVRSLQVDSKLLTAAVEELDLVLTTDAELKEITVDG